MTASPALGPWCLPMVGDILPSLPPALKARLFAVFDLEVLWNKPGGQATVSAEITEATLDAVSALLDPGQDGFHDTHPASTDDPAAMCHGCGSSGVRDPGSRTDLRRPASRPGTSSGAPISPAPAAPRQPPRATTSM